METWDAYDVDRIPTGKSVIRGAKHPEGLYHMVVHVAIFSTDGRLLIQQRCTQKATFPENGTSPSEAARFPARRAARRCTVSCARSLG